MQSMTYEFNKERVTENLFRFMGEQEKAYLPHAVMINEYLERLAPEELQKIQQKQVCELIRWKPLMMQNSIKNGWLSQMGHRLIQEDGN